MTFAMVALGTKIAASWARTPASSASSSRTVGSSPACSSPSRAEDMASIMPGEGSVLTSERRSMSVNSASLSAQVAAVDDDLGAGDVAGFGGAEEGHGGGDVVGCPAPSQGRPAGQAGPGLAGRDLAEQQVTAGGLDVARIDLNDTD